MTVAYGQPIHLQIHQQPNPDRASPPSMTSTCPSSPVTMNPFDSHPNWAAPHSPEASETSPSPSESPRSAMDLPNIELNGKSRLAAARAINMSNSDYEQNIVENDPTTARALMLLQQATAAAHALQLEHQGEAKKADSTQQQHHASLTTRQAAQLQYEQKLVHKAIIQAKLEQQKEQTAIKPTPKLFVPTPPELLATSSRPKRQVTADDVRDPETIAGMKYQLQWEWETKAQEKARRLLTFLDTEIM
ncbi:hypothetical protein MPSEU_000835200 [Mayamaea pseudoterrestris]|nr:hypothetical protein MPSEU_000835200 [Mayamaea pseudoterrestris]